MGVLDFQFTASTSALDAGVAKAEASLARLEKTAGGLNFDLGGATASKSIGDLQTTLTRFDTTVKANGTTISKYREEMSATAMATAQLKQAQADAAEMLALYRKNMADVAETQVLLKETQVEAAEQLIKTRAAQEGANDALAQQRVAAAGAADATALLRNAQAEGAVAATALKVAQTETAEATTALRVAQQGTAQSATELKLAQAGAADALAQQRVASAGAADATALLRTAQTGTADAATALKVAQTGAADAMAAGRVAATSNAAALNDARVATEELRAEKVALATAAAQEATALKASSAASAEFKGHLDDMAGATKKAAEALGLLIIAETAVDALSAKMAADWQAKTNEIQNNTVMTTADVKVMDAAIRDMASRTPASMNDLADGFAHIFNFGNSATDSVKLLNVAMMSAVSTGTKVADVANLLASVMHEFKINVDDAGTTMNVLHVAAAEGNQTLQSFVENSSAALSIAANLGVSLNQTAAGFIALSRSGLDASRVNTQMIGIMTHIINPTAGATKEIQRLSKATGIDLVSDFTLGGIQTRGFSGIMADLEKAIAGGGDEILKLIPALRGGTGALALTGSAAGDLDTALASINDTVAGKTNPTLDAFQRTQETLDYKVGVFKNTVRLLAIELGTVLLPVIQTIIDGMTRLGDAIGAHFNVPGISQARQSTDDLNAAMAAADGTAKQLGGSLGLPGQNGVAEARQKVQDLKDTVTDLDTKILQANTDIAGWTASLKDTREAMATINDNYKSQIDPLEAQLRHNDLPTAADSARSATELQLELKKANLDIGKPDVSQYTDAAQAAQDTKDFRDAFDSSSFDANIADAQAWKESLGEFDATPFTSQIKSIQDEIDSLNTNELDDKINTIKDKLAEPAPDTTGITNQLAGLNAALAGGTISQSAFNSQYGALSLQKQGIETKYQDDTTGLKGQLKLLEQQRTDQAQAQKETKQADEAHIRSIRDAQAAAEKEHKAQVDAADASIKESTKERETAKKAYDDETNRLDKIIKQNDDKAKAMLKPYTDSVNVINKQLDYNHALDAAASLLKQIADLPIKTKIEQLQSDQKDLIDPLQATADGYQKLIDKSTEDVRQWQLKKDAINETLKALGNMPVEATPGQVGYGKGIMPGGFSPYDEPQKAAADAAPFIGPMPNSGVVQGVSQFVDKMVEFGTWVTEHGDAVKFFVATLAVAFVALGIVLNPAAALIIGLTAVVGFFIYDYETNSTFKAFIDGIADAFNNLTDKLAGAINGVRTFLGLIPGKGPVGDNGSVNYNPAFPPGGPVDANGNPIPQATSSGGGPSLPDPTAFGPLGAVAGGVVLGAKTIKNIFGGLFGGGDNKVGASDLGGQQAAIDDFVQHIQDSLGDNGVAQAAIQSFKDQIVTEMGQGSSAEQAVQDAEKTFTDTFGDGSTVQAAMQYFRDNGIDPTDNLVGRVIGSGGSWQRYLASFGTTAQQQVGANSPSDAAFKNFTDGSLTNVQSKFTTVLGPGGAFDGAASNTVATAQSSFGAGGTMDGHLTNVGNKVSGVLGQGGTGQADMTSFDAHTASIFGPSGTVIGSFGSLVNWVAGDWQNLSNSISQPFTTAEGDIQSFFTFLSQGINWLADHFKLPPIDAFVGATAGAGIDKNAVHGIGHADGLGGGMAGHWAMIGERGPEAMYVPPNATIVPNHLLPGHADGLNIGGVFDALLASRGGSTTGAAQPFADTLAANLGAPTIPGLAGGGAALTDAVRGGVYDWLKESPGNIGPRSSGGSAMAIVNAVESVTSDPDIWLSMLMAVASEQRTLTGPFIDQLGGGPGRGPFQIEAGPGGSNAGMISEDDARDPFKAAQYMVGRFVAAKRGPWGTDEETAGAMTAAAAEVGAAFLAGNPLGYPRSVVDASYAMAKAALAAQAQAGPTRTPATSGTGDPDALNDALSYVGETVVPRGQYAGQPWDYFCEVFNEMVAQDEGLGYSGDPTARAHAARLAGSLRKDGIPPAGYSAYWDETFFPGFGGAGHVAISEGDGTFVSSHVGGISDHYGSGWLDHPGYLGYAPPGAAEGGLFTKPTVVTIGEGKEREWALPDSKLRETVREASGGGATINLAPGAVQINVGPRDDPRKAGADAWEAFEEKARQSGRILTH